MKHLFLKDDELTFMVYYQPKQKAKLYELIFKTEQNYWKSDYENSDWGLLSTIIIKLQENGFKVKEITQELKEAIEVYDDLAEDSFDYKGITINESMYSGYCFYLNDSTKSFHSCATIEEAIETIDKELK